MVASAVIVLHVHPPRHVPAHRPADREGRTRHEDDECRQRGGPRDHALRGETADEVIKGPDQHLEDTVAGDDDTHGDALRDMKGRWKHPLSGMTWCRSAKREFAAQPEE
jgi:hypothetical protein